MQASGFKNYSQTGIVLQVAENLTQNVALQVGSLTETVEVTGGASMVETRDSSIAHVIEQQRIVDLPLNGRNLTSLLMLSGVATSTMTLNGGDLTGSKNMGGSNGSGQFSVAGGAANGVNFLLDGGDNNDAFSNVNMPIPFPDAVQEFSVQTNGLARAIRTAPRRRGQHRDQVGRQLPCTAICSSFCATAISMPVRKVRWCATP